ncbi:hypothetical protein BH23PAT1_BH23PAT1_1170 [soil metagenome]
MKQKDIVTIILVAGITGVIAFLLANFFIASSQQLETEVEVVEPISADFPVPDERYFNEKAINPTQLIRIEENKNTNPFN